MSDLGRGNGETEAHKVEGSLKSHGKWQGGVQSHVLLLPLQGYSHGDLPDVGEGVALREVVGMSLPEDMAHPAAGDDFQTPSTHPHPEGELCRRPQQSGRGRGPP